VTILFNIQYEVLAELSVSPIDRIDHEDNNYPQALSMSMKGSNSTSVTEIYKHCLNFVVF